jgi:hypothetical protein
MDEIGVKPAERKGKTVIYPPVNPPCGKLIPHRRAERSMTAGTHDEVMKGGFSAFASPRPFGCPSLGSSHALLLLSRP